jgi:hypothetical protein
MSERILRESAFICVHFIEPLREFSLFPL